MQDGGKLAGKRALISGGSRGIGGAIARSFAGEGAAVAVLHLDDEENAGALVADVTRAGGSAWAFSCDVSDAAQVAAAVDGVAAELGDIDILVNCAGYADAGPFEDVTVADWDRMIGVHLRGTFLVTHGVYGGMRARGYGRIINIASQLAYMGAAGMTHYCAAKAGIIGFTRALALEAAPHGVTVNAIAPGATETDLLRELSPEWRAEKVASLPIGRFGRPADIAPTAVLLASDDGGFYVGQTLSPNGGDVML